MQPAWMLLVAVFAPVAAGLATLALPRRAVTARVLLAAAGPALAFVMVLTHLGAYGVAGGGPGGAGFQPAVQAQPEVRGDRPGPSGQRQAGSLPHSENLPHSKSTHHPIAATADLPWVPALDLNIAFLADGLGGFFALLVSGVGVLIVLYARGYFGGHGDQAEADLARFYPTLGFFATAMMGVVLADYTLLTLVFWELTSISSFLLIGWDRYDRRAVRLAMQAFFTTGLGGMFLLGGIAWFGSTTGIWRWSTLLADAATINYHDPAVIGAFLCMFVGAASKSAQWPLHYWLPGAMAAPTPVSAYLHSATMVKAGVFLVGRLFPAFGLGASAGFGTPTGVEIWAGVVTWFGAVTMLYAAVTAVNQHDLKRIFAYTTVSQLGLLMAMYGLGGFWYAHDGHFVAAAIDFDVTQIANHAFYKAPLFITAGAIGHVASRSLPDLFGAFHKHKAICITMLLAGYALAAGPGTISFTAKELFLYALVHAAEGGGGRPWIWIILLMTVLTAVCNVAIFVRLLTTLMGWRFGLGSGGSAKPQAAHDAGHHDEDSGGHHHEGGVWGAMLWLPAVPLVALQYLGGLVTPAWNALFLPFERFAFYDGFYGAVPWVPKLGVPLYASLIAIAGGVAFGLSRFLRGQHVDVNDRIYPAVYEASTAAGRGVFRGLQTGSLKHYVVAVLVTLCGAFLWAAWSDGGMWGPVAASAGDFFEFWPGLLLGLIICASALMLPVFESRVVRVLILGACGFTVVAMYVVYQAPDLALTQLMVEIISVLLFVLVLRMLPAERHTVGVGWVWRSAIGAVAGLMLGWMTLVAAAGNPTTRLGAFFAQHTYKGSALTDGRGGGGDNIVNVILVDFRGFDTLGEIIVLALAALGVWSMLPGRGKELNR